MSEDLTGLRIGLLGAARITGRAVADPARRTGHRLVVVAARDEGDARAFAAEHGVERVAASYEDLLADPEVEVVYNPLPNGLHAEWNLRAIRAGKHVLGEKPFAANGPEARRVADAARSAGTVVMEAYHYAFHPVMRRVLEVVASGEIGTVRHVEATLVIPDPGPDDPRWSLRLAGGALMDLGCYGLHAVRQLGGQAGGEPRVRAARARQHPGSPGVDAWLHASLDYPDGATATCFTSMDGPDVVMELSVVGTQGRVHAPRFVLPHEDDRVVVATADRVRTEHLGVRSSYDYQLDVLTRAVRRGTPPPLDLTDAVRTMELLDAAYVAAGLGPRPCSS